MNAALRPLWRIAGVLATAVAVLVVTASMVSAMVRDEELVRRILTAEEAVHTLSVSVEIGTIEVVVGDERQVKVEGILFHGFDEVELTTELTSGVAVVAARCPGLSQWCRVDLRIEVPAGTDVESVISNGRLLVSDIDGDVHVRGGNLVVDLIDVAAGDVRAQIRNGTIEMVFDAPPRAVEATIGNGRIDIELPVTEASYRVDMAAGNGSTQADIRTDPSSDRSIVARTQNGGVNVRYRD